MAIYNVIFLLILLISFVSVFVKINKYYSVFIFFILLLFGVLRYKIGMDYDSYEEIFDSIKSEPLSLSDVSDIYIEPGYGIAISYLKFIGFGNIGLFAVHMILSLYFIHKAIIKYSYNPFISWLIFYGVYYANLFFNGIRQGLFIAIILYILPIFLRREKFAFLKVLISSVLLAFFLHKTALILPVMYLLCIRDPSLKNKYIILFVSMIWAFTGIGNILIQVGGLSFIKDAGYLGVVDFYSQNEAFGAEIKLLSVSVLHRLLILLLALYFSKFEPSNLIFKKMVNIYFWGIVIYFFLTPLGYMLATRVGMNLKVFDVLLIPYFLIFLKEYKFKVSGLVLVSLWSFSVMLTNFYLPGNYPYYIPYRTIFSK
ncbi:MAG: EpsG family protein [Flavobacterium circumlabens]|uniref:EpsG family protein n=1 Tax=Flavobacterium circumlabens TaxID=2133765 RepID=UPI0032679EAF